MVDHIWQMSKIYGNKRKFPTPDDLQTAVDAYFADCDKKKKPYTVTGLAIGVGLTSRLALMNYQHRGDYASVVLKAKLKVENYLEDLLLTSKSYGGAIFNLKSNFGWREPQEIDVKGSLTVKILKFADGSHSAK